MHLSMRIMCQYMHATRGGGGGGRGPRGGGDRIGRCLVVAKEFYVLCRQKF